MSERSSFLTVISLQSLPWVGSHSVSTLPSSVHLALRASVPSDYMMSEEVRRSPNPERRRNRGTEGDVGKGAGYG